MDHSRPSLKSSPVIFRPAGWECPWCGPNAVPVDRSIPVELRLCAECAAGRGVDPEPVQGPRRGGGPVVEDLRAILRGLAVEVRARTPWDGCEFGKSILGGALLGALQEHGCNPSEEMAMLARDVFGRSSDVSRPSGTYPEEQK